MATPAGRTAPPSGGAASRPCSKCKTNPRRGNSSWCKVCLDAQAADYRARTRKPPAKEERTCALPECDETFTWSSQYPTQDCCSKKHRQRLVWREKNPRPDAERLPEGQKRCGRCKEPKVQADFAPSQYRRGGGFCQACARETGRAWDAQNRDRRSAATRRSRTRRILRRYGAPTDEIEDLLAAQGGGCAICGRTRTEAEPVFHVDHDHAAPESESYRGLLCGQCNAGIGYFADDPERLRSAIAYLEAHRR